MTMKFEKGKSYKTRGGDEAICVAAHSTGNYKFCHSSHGVITEHDDNGETLLWRHDGSSKLDIIGEWVEPVKVRAWIGVSYSPDGDLQISSYDCKEDAIEFTSGNLELLRHIEYTEGQGIVDITDREE